MASGILRVLLPIMVALAAPALLWAQEPPMRPSPRATPGPLGQPLVELPPELDRILREYETAWKAGDGEALSRLFTEDGFALASGQLPLKGRAAIAQWHRRPGGDLQLHAFAYAVSDTVGYIIGGYRYPQSTGPGGKYLLAIRRGTDGKWLIAADMDNSAMPGR